MKSCCASTRHAARGVDDPLLEALAERMDDLMCDVAYLEEEVDTLTGQITHTQDTNERLQDMLDDTERKNEVTSN